RHWAGIPLVAWGVWIGGWAGVVWVWRGADLAPALLSGAAAAAVLVGAAILVRPPPEPGVWRVPDLSVASALTAIGVTTVIIGTAFGGWLVLLGAELTLIGLVGVGRELWIGRRRPAAVGSAGEAP